VWVAVILTKLSPLFLHQNLTLVSYTSFLFVCHGIIVSLRSPITASYRKNGEQDVLVAPPIIVLIVPPVPAPMINQDFLSDITVVCFW